VIAMPGSATGIAAGGFTAVLYAAGAGYQAAGAGAGRGAMLTTSKVDPQATARTLLELKGAIL